MIFYSLFLGIIFGTISGIIPGIHVNSIGAIVFSFSLLLLNTVSIEFLSIFLVSMSIAHALLEFIPSILIGVPDESTAMSILPGHKMVLEGKSKEAIRLVSIGGFGAIIITILLFPIFMLILPTIYPIIKPYFWILLTVISFYMFLHLNCDMYGILWSFLLFIASGIIGWTVLQSPISSNISLMSLFTGLFGISTILFSLNENNTLSPQSDNCELNLNNNILQGICVGGIAGTILGFLPGFGPAQGTVIAQILSGSSEEDYESFLTSMSGVNSSDTLFSLISIYLIGNARSGISVYISQLVETFTINHILLFMSSSLVAVSLSLILCLKLGDIFSNYMEKINYKQLSIVMIFLMSFLIFFFAFIEKAPIIFIFLIFITSTALGLLPHYLNISKSNLMGVLIVQAIIIYFQMFF